MISFTTRGSTKRTEDFLKKMSRGDIFRRVDAAAARGVAALAAATPANTGKAASSWSYKITQSRGRYTITWTNSDIEDGFPVAVMIQYGHGTGTGGYVQGIDYINPTLRPIFQQIADDVWKEVTSA